MRRLRLMCHKQIGLFACDIARLALPVWEKTYQDKRPRKAIETAELFCRGKVTESYLKQAENEAWAASGNIFASTREVHAANAAANAAWTSWRSPEKSSLLPIMRTFENVKETNHYLSSVMMSILEQATAFVEIPITLVLQSIAEHIVQTRNFQEYYVLLDNLEEVHSITLPREVPLGLSHYVLFHLTNTN